MRGFNKVFGVVKKLSKQTNSDTSNYFDLICEEMNIDEKTLVIHLNILQNMRLITYDAVNKRDIKLTSLGERVDDIPSSLS